MPTIKKEIDEKKKKAMALLVVAMDAATVDIKHGEIARAMETLQWGISRAQKEFPVLIQKELFS